MSRTADDIFISAEACFLSNTSCIFSLLYRLINPRLDQSAAENSPQQTLPINGEQEELRNKTPPDH